MSQIGQVRESGSDWHDWIRVRVIGFGVPKVDAGEEGRHIAALNLILHGRLVPVGHTRRIEERWEGIKIGARRGVEPPMDAYNRVVVEDDAVLDHDGGGAVVDVDGVRRLGVRPIADVHVT